MRSFISQLVLEQVFVSIPTFNKTVTRLADAIFNPKVQIVSTDCGTRLGTIEPLNKELQGETLLSTGQVITNVTFTSLATSSASRIAVRHINTCAESTGVCKKCYDSNRRRSAITSVGATVSVPPVYYYRTDTLHGTTGDHYFHVADIGSPTSYEDILVYFNGVLQEKSTYTMTNITLILNNSLTQETDIVIKYLINTKVPYLQYLSNTYSGSLLGLEQVLMVKPLPIRVKVLNRLIDPSMLSLCAKDVKALKHVPEVCKDYIDRVPSKLEKALFIIALYCIYSPMEQY